MDIKSLAKEAFLAAKSLASIKTEQKNKALLYIIEELTNDKDEIIKANVLDLKAAYDLSPSLKNRLLINHESLQNMIEDIKTVISLKDPVGSDFDSRVLPNGLRLFKRKIPLGVIAAIYESRPNVSVDIATLCIKSGNACVLKGGSESLNTNKALIACLKRALKRAKLPPACVSFIEKKDKKYIKELLSLDEYIAMIIPRGGETLHSFCKQNSSIPVIIGGFGVSHIYVDWSAEFKRSLDIIENSKTQHPSACNSLDTLLIHKNIPKNFFKAIALRMAKKGVRLHACKASKPLLANASLASKEDFYTEWLGLDLNIKIVASLDEALAHMREHKGVHSDSILTNDLCVAQEFLNKADSACVYVNAATRFSDGAQFGLGAEVAISTSRLHARGPMGLDELCTYKWIGMGDYLSRA